MIDTSWNSPECDLHIHTTYSDGSMPVRDVIYYARKTGLSCIAVTDHDSLYDMDKTVSAGEAAGIRIIPGVEATVRDTRRNRPVHVLCYLPKYPDILQTFLNRTLENRKRQKLQMLAKVKKLYPLLEEDKVLYYARESRSVYEPHIMQPLCDLGYTNAAISTLEEELISKTGSCYVPSIYPDIYELLEYAKKARAFITIAHPGQFDSFDLAEELAEQRLIHALEYSHPRNNGDAQKRILQIAGKYDLLLTGGSDFHGQYAKNPHPLGSFGCSADVVKEIIAYSKSL